MNDFIIDFQVTSRCNLKCKFCCGADKIKVDSDYSIIKDTVDKLKLAGVDRIVLTGGEPLIRKDIDKIIEYISDNKIGVYLSTNGYFLNEHIDTVVSRVDCVGLPLDGDTGELSELMSRRHDQIETTMNAIKLLKSKNPNIITKVGTVVSKLNFEKLISIGKNILYLNKEIEPDVWRLYQFTPLGEGLKNSQMFEISNDEYEETIKKIKNEFKDKNIGSLSNKESNDTYMFVAPDMELIALTNDNYVNLGNLKNMTFEDIITLKNNMKKTFDNAKKNRKWTITKGGT